MQRRVNKQLTVKWMLATFAFCLTTSNAVTVQAQAPAVIIETTQGNMVIELDPNAAPITVANFLTYVDAQFYDGLIFHRVIEDFMIQGGGFDPNLVQQPVNDPIVNESDNGLMNVRGAIAMARTSDPNSATGQFFINSVDNDFLNAAPGTNTGYAVFGHVVSGLDVLDLISAVETQTYNGFDDVPIETIYMNRIYPELVPFSKEITSSNSLTVVHRFTDNVFHISVTGKGHVLIEGTLIEQTGEIVSLTNMTISETNGNSTVSVIAEVEGDALNIDNLALFSGIKLLDLDCDIKRIVSGIGTKHKEIKTINLARVLDIDTPFFGYSKMNLGTLGDPFAFDIGFVDVKFLRELNVEGNIYATQLLAPDSQNIWKDIVVGGVIDQVQLFGRKIKNFTIYNDDNNNVAMYNSIISLDAKKGNLGVFTVVTGAIYQSDIFAGRFIKKILLLNGNFIGSSSLQGGSRISAASPKGVIKEIVILRGNNEDAGHLAFATIYAGRNISRLHVDGDVLNSVVIATATDFYRFVKTIKTISTGGNFSGTVVSLHINKIMIGYDYQGKRIPEPDNTDYTGSHLFDNAVIQALISIKEINVTGEIKNATIQSYGGKITNIFAEDGIFNSQLTANSIKYIMLGYLDGSRKHPLVNEDAGISNVTLVTGTLGRLYYTGSLDDTFKAELEDIRHIFVYDEIVE
jgi:cyclophilin family peptidyl-prolyl cis-trans isomerase